MNLESLVQKVQTLGDAEARGLALELVRGVMDLHASGVGRMMELASTSACAAELFEAFANDPAVSCILLLHGEHPYSLEERVRRALANPSLRGRGANVELLGVVGAVVRIRMQGGPALAAAVREGLAEAAPDAEEIVIEGETLPPQAFVPLEQLVARPAR